MNTPWWTPLLMTDIVALRVAPPASHFSTAAVFESRLSANAGRLATFCAASQVDSTSLRGNALRQRAR